MHVSVRILMCMLCMNKLFFVFFIFIYGRCVKCLAPFLPDEHNKYIDLLLLSTLVSTYLHMYLCTYLRIHWFVCRLCELFADKCAQICFVIQKYVNILKLINVQVYADLYFAKMVSTYVLICIKYICIQCLINKFTYIYKIVIRPFNSHQRFAISPLAIFGCCCQCSQSVVTAGTVRYATL